MFKTRIVLMVLMAAVTMAPVLTGVGVLDNMDNIGARPWVDDRDPAQGSGWLSQGAGVMKIDYGVTYDGLGVPPSNPNPLSGWDYQDNFVGVGTPGGVFGDPALGGADWSTWSGGAYYGDSDRVPSASFSPAELGILTISQSFTLDVFKTVANSSEHVRELQLYDSLGGRSTYSVQAEATAGTVGAGWKTYTVPLSSPLENNADLTDIVTIKLWVSSWSAFVSSGDGSVWPDDYTRVRPSGTPVLIDNLTLIPEPVTMTMLALGGLALLRRRKA